ncbi:MAG: response regulator [Bacteroides sp.]
MIFPVSGLLLKYSKDLKCCGSIPIKDGKKNTVFTKIISYDARYYMAITDCQRIILVDKLSGEVKRAPFSASLNRDSKNRLWIGYYGKGVCCYTHEGKLLTSYHTKNSDLSNDVVLDMQERNGQIWLATDGGGINIINPETHDIIILASKQNYRIPTNSVSCLCNGTNNMWIGMVREGVLGAKENFITTYTKSPENDPSGMSEKCPLCLHEEVDGNIWIGTDGGGINCFNPLTEKFTHFSGTFSDKVVSICRFSDTELLVSCFTKGIFVFNKKSGKYRRFLICNATVDDRMHNSAYPINLYVNAQGDIEFHGGEFYRYSKESKQFSSINTASERYNGSWVYVGDYCSKSYFQNKTLIFCYNHATACFEKVYSKKKNQIFSAYMDQKGELWIAGASGLSILNVDTGEMKTIKLPDGNDIVTSLIMDKKGVVWMGTPGALYAYIPQEQRFVIFSESDGVIPNDFLPKPVLLASDGNIYMGGAMGLVRVNTIHNRQTYGVSKNWKMSLLEINLNGNNVRPVYRHSVPQLEIPSSFASLVVYTKLDGTDVFRKRIYRYRIEGLNSGFTESSKSHFLISTLPPGTYEIKAQCTQSDGMWSPSFHLLNLTVLPPWWQRTWFILSIVLWLVLSVIYIIHQREQRLQQRLKEKERTIYKEKVQALININHELRTPLTLIYTPLKLLLNSRQMPYELRTTLQGAFKQARQMKNIINMILNMRRMEVGQNTLHLTPTRLNEWLQSIVNDFKDEFSLRNIHLQFYPDESIDAVAFDVNQCEIIVNNLLMNAYKFSNPETTVTVCTRLEQAGSFIRIEVSDEGIGLGDEDPQKLFTRFQQGHHSIAGSGIGLSYAKQLVEMHQGIIGAMNNKEKGSTFYFTLPNRHTVTDVQCPVKPYLNELLPSYFLPALPSGTQTAKFHSVVIVDDDPDLCDFLASNLQTIFEVIYVAHDGMEAIPIIVSHLPQLIISDVMMPRMDGLELCRRVKQNAELNYIPVILLASRVDEPSAGDGYKLGADAYVAKPFDLDLLLIQIQNILHNHNVMRKHYSASETSEAIQKVTNNVADEQFVIHLNSVIHENLANTALDVNLVSQQMRMSRASLYNKMKSTIGNGVNEYITKRRIEYATQLLITTELSIRDISEQAGFLHQRNFSTMFKNMTGESPSEYRKQRKD